MKTMIEMSLPPQLVPLSNNVLLNCSYFELHFICTAQYHKAAADSRALSFFLAQNSNIKIYNVDTQDNKAMQTYSFETSQASVRLTKFSCELNINMGVQTCHILMFIQYNVYQLSLASALNA